MFILFILLESPSVVISRGLAAVVKAGDRLAVLQQHSTAQICETRVRLYSEMNCSFRVL